jgi:hypothetical protein
MQVHMHYWVQDTERSQAKQKAQHRESKRLITRPLSEVIRSCKCVSHVSKMATVAYKRVNSVVVKKGHILNMY